jgi:hypothetical protein
MFGAGPSTEFSDPPPSPNPEYCPVESKSAKYPDSKELDCKEQSKKQEFE